MNQIGAYLYEYVKTNDLTLYFVLTLLAIASIKYLKFRLPWKEKTLFLVVLVLGLCLRIGWIAFSSHTPATDWSNPLLQENDLINIHAIELTKGIWFEDAQGVPSGRRPIGYPIVLGLFYKIFGVHLPVAWALHLLLYVATLFFLHRLAAIALGEKAALLVVLFYAIHPVSIYSINLITDEHLFLPLWYGGIYLLSRDPANPKNQGFYWLWYGLIFGLATMTRTHTVFMPAVVGIAYYLKRVPVARAFAAALLVGLTMQVINLPWVVRNYWAWGEVILYTPTGHFVYAQVNSTATPKGEGHIPEKGEEGYSEELAAALKAGNPARTHKIANRLMKEWILAHPSRFLSMGISRVLYFMNWNRQDGVWPLWYQFYEGAYDPERPLTETQRKFFEELAFSFYYTVLFSLIAGIVMLTQHWKHLPASSRQLLLILGLCFFFWFLEHLIIYPLRKYRYPLEPLMLIPACYFLYCVLTQFRFEALGNAVHRSGRKS